MPITQRIDIDKNEAMLLKIIATRKGKFISAILAELVRKYIVQESKKETARG
jgi:hypothetical protein